MPDPVLEAQLRALSVSNDGATRRIRELETALRRLLLSLERVQQAGERAERCDGVFYPSYCPECSEDIDRETRFFAGAVERARVLLARKARR